jgi:hypothetical protein
MLSTKRCPHTGVVNFYFDADPHLAVGSVIKAGRASYQWRCYTDPCAAVGTAPDLRTAERRVAMLCHRAAAVMEHEAAMGHAA